MISLSLSPALRCVAITSAFVALSAGLLAQAPQSTASSSAPSASAALVTSNATAPSLAAPPTLGLNLSLSSSSQYDDANGWSSTLTPTLSFRVNRFLSFDTSVPYYLATNTQVNTATRGPAVIVPVTAHNVFGDTNVAAHLEFNSPGFSYSFTPSGSLPSGDSYYNLSSNQPTYFLNNHFETSFGIFNPDIEIGQGNSSSSVRRSARQAYIAVGPIASFQIGTGISLPWNLNLDLEAYEVLPTGNQKVYGVVKRKNGKTVTVLQGAGVAEDNGFNVSLDTAITAHLGVAAFYNRSLRQYDNTTGFTLNYILRAPKRPRD